MAVSMVVAEDNILTSMILRAELEKNGYNVIALARSGPEVMESWRSTLPEVVVVDVMLPEMDGLQVTRAIMRERPTCIVIITGMGDYQQRADDAGAMGYLEKPFGIEHLIAEVERARRRFAWFMSVRGSGSDPEAVLESWPVISGAVRRLASRNHIEEEEAFQRLQQQALDQRLPLREVAQRELSG